MPTTDYGYGLTIEWSDAQIAMIRTFRASHAASRILGHPCKNSRRKHYYATLPRERERAERLTQELLDGAYDAPIH